jgi:hypothetical protein
MRLRNMQIDAAKKIGASSMSRACMICMLMMVGEDIANMRAPNPENSTAKGCVSTDGLIRWLIFLSRIQDWITIGYTFIRR